MKKQIFKLTSILLAMVMVFTMFTMIPISAEGTDKATALSNLQSAWLALTYDGYVDRISANYIGTAQNTGSNYATNDAPPQAPESVDNRKITIGSTSTNIYFNEFVSGNFATNATTNVPIKNIKDMYFYYKSTADISAKFTCIGNNGSTRINSIFGTAYTLPSTNGEWVKYSFDQWLVANGYSWNWLITNHAVKDATQLAAIGFGNANSSTGTDFYLSELFVVTGVDTNLEGHENWSDIQWVSNANEVNLSDYAEDSESDEVKAFNEALALVNEYFAKELVVEDLRIAAGKMFKYGKSILYPNKYWVTKRVIAEKVASTSPEWGDYTHTYTVPNVGTMAYNTVTGQWLTIPNDLNSGGEINEKIDVSGTGEAYVKIRVNSITDANSTTLAFRYRANSTGINEPLTFKLPVEAGKEYVFSLSELFAGSQAANWKTFFGTYNFNFLVIAAEGAAANITVGSAVYEENYQPSDKTGEEFVAEMAVLDTSLFYNTEEFETALEAALEEFPEVEEVILKLNTLKSLKSAWRAMNYIPQSRSNVMCRYGAGGSETIKNYFNVYSMPEEARQAYLDNDASGVGTAYKFPVADLVDSNGTATTYEHFEWGVSTDMEDIVSMGFWYKSTVAINTVRTVFGTTQDNTKGTLPSTNGEWQFLNLRDVMTAAEYDAMFNGKYTAATLGGIRIMLCHTTKRTADISFGDLVVTVNDLQIKGIDDLSATALINKADSIDLSVYEDDDKKDAFLAAVAAAKEAYAIELAAVAVKDAATSLNNELFMKPVITISPAREDDVANSNVAKDTVFGTSNKGDLYTTVNTAEIGNADCSPQSGAIMYEAAGDGVLLKDIEDITFSYKVENKEGDLTVARIFFFNENYIRYLRTMNEETGEEEFVLDEEGNKILDRGYWQTGMQTHGTTRYLAFDADTDGWVETSLATIFGSNWKEIYLGYLNGSDIKTEDFTEDNTYISKLSFGFNTKEGANADVSVGSMYIKKTDASAYTITAADDDFEGILTEARAINFANSNIAKANEFKKAVKALETKIGADAMDGYIAGNWYADGLTFKDLSVLSRKNDGTLGDTFCDEDAIGDLTEESIRKTLLGIPQ